MIDWYSVAANALWIAGLSVVAAAFSYHDWIARETNRKRRDLFKQRSWQLFWTSGMSLTCVGWALSQTSRWWGTLMWLALGAWFAGDFVRLLRAPASILNAKPERSLERESSGVLRNDSTP